MGISSARGKFQEGGKNASIKNDLTVIKIYA